MVDTPPGPEPTAMTDDAPDPPDHQPKNPLHGVTLERIVTELVEHFGWAELGQQVRINCFTTDPSISSSLKFLRKSPWARAKVESLYLFMLRDKKRRGSKVEP